MALMIRGPLVMADGYKAKSLEDLQEHFNLETVLEAYYDNGRLFKWLQGLGLEDELDAIQALDDKVPDFVSQICTIFQVPYTGDPVDQEAIQERLERLKRLKRVTDEVEHHRSVDRVVFCQEELAKLVLEEGETLVYLCQEEGEDFTFTIPSSCKGVTYRGIPCKGKQPRVRVTRNAWNKLAELDIRIDSCDLIKPEQAQTEPEELEGNREEPIQQFLDSLFQKAGNDSLTELEAAVTIFEPGRYREDSKTIQGTAAQLKEKMALLVQECAAPEGEWDDDTRNEYEESVGEDTGFIGGVKVSANGFECKLMLRPDFSAKAQVQGAHIERNAGGGRIVFVDLLRPVTLNGKKYRSIPILSSEVYENLSLREGSEITVFCLGDLSPAIRVYERGRGKSLRCPHCGSRFQVRDECVICENPVCIDHLHERIYGFLHNLGLSYNPSFVQKMITELPIKSIRDLFQIDTAMLEQHHLDSNAFRSFPEKLRTSIAGVSAETVLGGLGIPGLEPRSYRVFNIFREAEFHFGSNSWGAFISFLDSITLPYSGIEENVHRWLCCDPRTIEEFRAEIVALQPYVNCSENSIVLNSGEDGAVPGIRRILRRGAYIGVTGIEITYNLIWSFNRKGLNLVKSGELDRWKKINAVVIPTQKYFTGSKMVDYARKRGIPIYNSQEFMSALDTMDDQI